jgi:hypothetical protein
VESGELGRNMLEGREREVETVWYLSCFQGKGGVPLVRLWYG